MGERQERGTETERKIERETGRLRQTDKKGVREKGEREKQR